ncbi:hypothetical protein BA011_22625 [Rhizobium leguminosarum]|uniref:UvrD-like helicase C-terminal domain-containing protein n=1 Tax=Rhizobium leguminosarum TaxID=384 RepID=A0A1B1CET7_RHILE|nr:hypothetical protein BA011_22625 [Rhizobium leguminosarum]
MPLSSDSVAASQTRRSGSGPYLTHHERRYQKYADGGIAGFLRNELPRKVPIEIDETTRSRSHRSSAVTCAVSLYPAFPASKAVSVGSVTQERLALAPLSSKWPTTLTTWRRSADAAARQDHQHRRRSSIARHDFGESKGRGFDHVVILPTEPMRCWLSDPASDLKPQSRAKLYVALTRGRRSAAIAMDWGSAPLPAGFSLYRRTAPS